MRKILPADTLTPILAYMRVQGEHKVILESIPREKENARFSIVAYNPVFEVTFKDGVLYENGKAIDQDPFEYLDQGASGSWSGGNEPTDSGAKRVYTSGLASFAIFESYRKRSLHGHGG